MAGFGSAISELAIRISADSSSAGKAFEDLAKKISDTEKSFSGIGTALSGLFSGSGGASDVFSSVTAGVFSFNDAVDAGMSILGEYGKALSTVAQIAGYVVDPIKDIAVGLANMTLAGGALTEVSTGFENLTKNAGLNSASLIQGVSAATDHLYTFQEIMKSTANAVSAGFGQDQIVTLYQFGNKVADVTDKFGDARQIAETMTQAIISGNERVLKQFDIVIQDGASVAEVFEQIRAKMAGFGKGGFNLSEKFQAIGVQASNIIDALSEGLNRSFEDSGLGQVLDQVAQKIQELVPVAKDFGLLFSPIAFAIGETARIAWEMGGVILQTFDALKATITQASWTDIFKEIIVASGNAVYEAVNTIGSLFNFFTTGLRGLADLTALVGEGVTYLLGWEEASAKFQKLGETIERTSFNYNNLTRSQSMFTDAVLSTGKATESTGAELDRMYKRSTENAFDMAEKIGKVESDLSEKIVDLNARTAEKISNIEEKRLQAKQELSEKLQKIESDRIAKIAEAEARFEERMNAGIDSYEKERRSISTEANEKLMELARNFQREKERAEAEHGRRLASMAIDHENRRRQIAEQGEQDRRDLTLDYQSASLKLAKDHEKARLAAQKEGAQAVAEVDREYAERRAELSDNFRRQAAKSLADQLKQEREAEENYHRQVSEANSQFAQQQKEAEAKYAQDRAKIIEDANKRQAELEQKHTAEIEKLKKELAEKLADIDKKSHTDTIEAQKDYQKKMQELQREENEAYERAAKEREKINRAAQKKIDEINEKYWKNAGEVNTDSYARDLVAIDEQRRRMQEKVNQNLATDLQKIEREKQVIGDSRQGKGAVSEIRVYFEKTGDPFLDMLITALNRAARAEGVQTARQ